MPTDIANILENLDSKTLTPAKFSALLLPTVQRTATAIANAIIIDPAYAWLRRKINALQKKKQLKKQYEKILKSNLIELLKMLEDPNINEENIILIKKLILISLLKDADDEFEMMRKEYLSLAKSLTPVDISLMAAAYKKVGIIKYTKDNLDIDEIYNDLASTSKIKYPTLVAQQYLSLMNRLVFKPPWNAEKSKINANDGLYIFTEFGYDFMDYLQKYKHIIN